MSSIAVRKIDIQADHTQTIATLKEWKEYAAKQGSVARQLPGRFVVKALEDMGAIHTLSTTMIRILKYKQTWYDCYFASHAGELQGAIVLHNNTKGYREIHALFTRPHNLSCAVEQGAEKIRGVGRALITHVVHEMLQNNDERDLLAQSTRQSISFYEKCHFHEMTHNTADFYYWISNSQRILSYDPQALLVQTQVRCKHQDAMPLPAVLGAKIIDFLLPRQKDAAGCAAEKVLVEAFYQEENERTRTLFMRQWVVENNLSDNFQALTLVDPQIQQTRDVDPERPLDADLRNNTPSPIAEL